MTRLKIIAACAGAVAALSPAVGVAQSMPIGSAVAPPAAFLAFCAREPAECSGDVTRAFAAPSASSPAPSALQDRAPQRTRGKPLVNWRLAFQEARLASETTRTLDVQPWPQHGYTRYASAPDENALPWDRQLRRMLNAVNRDVNWRIRTASDQDVYGVSDLWTLPLTHGGRRGDCEDYVLEKRRALIERGVPASALSISIVTTQRGVTHAVLLVNTSRGEYVLDSLTDRIASWSDTGYSWGPRQVAGRAGEWAVPETRLAAGSAQHQQYR